MKSRVLRSCSWFSDTPAFLRNGLSASSSPDRSNPLLAFQPTCVTCLKFDGVPMSAFVSFRGLPLFWLMKDCCWYGGCIWGGASFAGSSEWNQHRSRSERNFPILMLAGFLKVTDPSSMTFDLLLKLLFKLLFVIGGGLAGGSFRPPRVRRSAKRRKLFPTAHLETTLVSSAISTAISMFTAYLAWPQTWQSKYWKSVRVEWKKKTVFRETTWEISPRPSLLGDESSLFITFSPNCANWRLFRHWRGPFDDVRKWESRPMTTGTSRAAAGIENYWCWLITVSSNVFLIQSIVPYVPASWTKLVDGHR